MKALSAKLEKISGVLDALNQRPQFQILIQQFMKLTSSKTIVALRNFYTRREGHF